MVKMLSLFLFLWVTSLSASDLQLDAEVQWNSIYENTPFTVTITVTHDQKQNIDVSSFEMDKKKIEVQWIKNVRFSPSSPIILSIYEYEMEGMPAGLQMLPVISVTVGGKKISSVPTGFEVKSTPNTQKQAALLKLESIYEGPKPLYPGQKATIGYRYVYNKSIDLAEEILPLLTAEGFKKVGEKFVEDKEIKGLSTRLVTQQIQAINPGVYSFGPSLIVGYAYTEDELGKKNYFTTPLKSQTNPIEITVAPFPDKNRPTSFNGAVGDFSFYVTSTSKSELKKGDQVDLEIKVAGKGDFDTVQLPDLCCQPRFSGFFSKSDLPPIVKGNEQNKIFKMELILNNSDIEEIPPIEFSFFNPEKLIYTRLLSKPITLTLAKETFPELNEESNEIILPKLPSPSFVLISYALPLSLVGIATFGLGSIVLLSHVKVKNEIQKVRDEPSASQKLMEIAIQNKNNESFYPFFSQAVRRYLYDKNMITNSDISLLEMPESELKRILVEVEENRFSKEFQIRDPSQLIEMAKKVMI